jgi:hypothetical protein
MLIHYTTGTVGADVLLMQTGNAFGRQSQLHPVLVCTGDGRRTEVHDEISFWKRAQYELVGCCAVQFVCSTAAAAFAQR